MSHFPLPQNFFLQTFPSPFPESRLIFPPPHPILLIEKVTPFDKGSALPLFLGWKKKPISPGRKRSFQGGGKPSSSKKNGRQLMPPDKRRGAIRGKRSVWSLLKQTRRQKGLDLQLFSPSRRNPSHSTMEQMWEQMEKNGKEGKEGRRARFPSNIHWKTSSYSNALAVWGGWGRGCVGGWGEEIKKRKWCFIYEIHTPSSHGSHFPTQRLDYEDCFSKKNIMQRIAHVYKLFKPFFFILFG